MDIAERVKEIIEPAAQGMGFEIVRVRYFSGRSGTLQIMAERPDGTMTIDDCAALSRSLSALLDVEDPISQHYRLEVSSPGIDRPLTRPKDFANWSGHEAKIEMKSLIGGRKRFRGVLKGLSGDKVLLVADGPDGTMPAIVALPFAEIADAKLILTDELLKRASPVDASQFDDIEIDEETTRHGQA